MSQTSLSDAHNVNRYWTEKQVAACLILLLSAAFVARSFVCFRSGLTPYNTDTYDYLKMADAILEGKPFSYFPNGYPLLIAFVKAIAGNSYLVEILLFLNVLMSTSLVLVTFSIALRFMESAFWELWGPWPQASNVDMPRSTITKILIGLRCLMILLAIAAFWSRRSSVEIGLVMIPIILITVVHTAFFSTPRFTFPVEPLVLVLATLGMADVARLFGRVTQK
jgi:hypothetical protein